MAMRTVDPEKHAAKRLAILDAAARCFARSGFEQTRTAEIAKAAGISSGALFHYFPSKMAMFSAIFEFDRAQNSQRLAAAEASADPWGALKAIVAEQMADAANPDYAGLPLEVAAQANRDPQFAALVLGNDAALKAGLARLLERAETLGQLQLVMTAENTAGWLMALIDGAFSRMTSDPDFSTADGVRLVERLVDLR